MKPIHKATARGFLAAGFMLFAWVLTLAVVHAADIYPWIDHAQPFDFLFGGGTDIDTHQQTLLNPSTRTLYGFLYVQFTGQISRDGLRVATHADCHSSGPPCVVGWQLRGARASATLVYQVEPDHPTWLVDRAGMPQPGAYSHFHWSDTSDMPSIGSTHSGYLLELDAVDTFCFVHHDVASFATRLNCEHEKNHGVVVRPGIDIATHVNIVASYPGYDVR